MSLSFSARRGAVFRWLGRTLSGIGLLHMAILGASLAVAVPAHAQSQQLYLTGCGATGVSSSGMLVGGEITTTPAFGWQITCSGLADGATLPGRLEVCMRFFGGGAPRAMKLDDGRPGTIPYEILPANPDIGGNDPITDEAWHYWYYDAVSGMPITFDVGVGPRIRFKPPQVTTEGAYQDRIRGEFMIQSLQSGGPACSTYRDSITSAIPFDILLTTTARSNCFIDTISAVTFPTLDIDISDGAKTKDTRAFGGIAVNCPDSTPYTIFLGPGLNSGGDPYMRVLKGPGDATLKYQLLKPGGDDIAWTDIGIAQGVNGPGGVTVMANGLPQTQTIQGVIRPGQPVPTGGTYTDRVTITVAY